MLIDWFTVAAQALNFLVLVWLLKRFLYKPILNAIDAREKRIAAELADATAKQADASKERDAFSLKNADFDKQRADMLAKATDAVNVERAKLLDAARAAAEQLSAQRKDALRAEAQQLNQSISRQTQREVFAIARKTLTDLAGVSLEERIGAVFIRRLGEMDGAARERLGNGLKTSAAPAIVRSAFDLPIAQRQAINNALNIAFSADIHLQFQTAPDLIAGIQLTTNGQQIAWTITDYLSALEQHITTLLAAPANPQVPNITATNHGPALPSAPATSGPKAA